jgi:hypothetical protein
VRGKLVRLFTVFVSSIEARQPRATVDRNTGTPQPRLNWKSIAHWNPFAAGQRTAPIWLDTLQVRARQHGIDFARQSNEHCLARKPRAIDTRLNVYPPNVARQWLGKNVTAAANTHAAIQELFGRIVVSKESRLVVLPRTLFCTFNFFHTCYLSYFSHYSWLNHSKIFGKGYGLCNCVLCEYLSLLVLIPLSLVHIFSLDFVLRKWACNANAYLT